MEDGGCCKRLMVLIVGSLIAGSQKDAEGSLRIIYIISGLFLIPVSLVLSIFLVWHIYLMLQNKTTIEYYEGVRAKFHAGKGGHLYSHPYDMGAYENLISILGPNYLCWICPTPGSGRVSSGLRFRTKYDRRIGKNP
ncbi:putative protein S-acyltransferase 16 [Forsythia ovata]|uniref:S-acyltransferase n=1 Tax=Forsythia ovata TaxID=205694 RepID=A0ABD1WY97_9LAMI